MFKFLPKFSFKTELFRSLGIVPKAIGMHRQPLSTWTFLTVLDRSPTTMAVSFRFQVTLGLKIAASWQERIKIERWEVLDIEDDDGDDQVRVLEGERGGRDVHGVWRRERHREREERVC